MVTLTERKALPSLASINASMLACLPFPAILFDTLSFIVYDSNAYFCMDRNMLLSSLLTKYDYDFINSDDLIEISEGLKTQKHYTAHKLVENINEIKTYEITVNQLDGENIAFLYFNQLSTHHIDNVQFDFDEKNTDKQLIAQAQLFNAVVTGISEGIGIIDTKYKITFCNSLFASFFSLNDQNIIGKDFIRLLDENKSETLAEIEINKFGLETSFELKRYKNDNKEQYLALRAVPRYDAKNCYSGSFITIFDITDRKLTEIELVISKGKAQESDRLKSSFLANLSHEIRTPMNSILGFSSMLQRTGIIKAKRDQYLDIIISKGKHLMSVISDIIDITKISENQIQIFNGPCDLNYLMEELFTTYSNELSKRNKPVKLLLNASYRTQYSCIEVDSIRLMQVLQNLLNNSVKFTNSGYIEFGFKYQDNNTLLFYVKDSGVGVSPELSETIFDRFRQADESFTRIFGGIGLGLAICKGLVSLMGGKIWVESDGICGSTFNFTLPIVNIDADTQLEVGNSLVNKKWNEKTIMIVEDDMASFQLLNEFLEIVNCNVIHASNGNDALANLKVSKCIDLVLLDIQLPIMDGYQVARSIREFNPTIPIIAQTAHALGNDKVKCMEAGCDDYLSKPIQFGVLAKMLNGYLA